jgi:hypothetical protein
MKLIGRSALEWTAKAVVGTTLAFVALACGPYGSYRVVKTQPHTAGEVALQGDRQLAHQKAEQYMTSECSGGYDIVEEGEAVTGSTSRSNADSTKQKDIFGQKVNNTQTSTRSTDTTEWRVKYKCKGAGDAPPSEKAATPAPDAPAKPSSAIKQIVVRF